MANHHGQDLPPALAHQPKVYQRSFQRHLRVLEAKMANLQIQLNDELSEKSSSSSGLQEDMGTNNTIPDQVPSCSELLDEIKRFSTKRDAILAANQQKINPGGDGNGNGDAPPPPAANQQKINPGGDGDGDGNGDPPPPPAANQQKINPGGDGDGNGDAPPPPPAAGI